MADLKMTPEKKEAFLALLEVLPNITSCAKAIGVHPNSIRRAREADHEFDRAVADSMECGYDTLEEEAIRRAKDGVPKPIFYRGMEVGTVQEYSDQLLTFLLKGYRPKKFNPGANIKIGDGEKVTMTFNIGGDE